jgi:hypothetical protein
MEIDVVKVLADPWREAAWRLYNDAFDELRATAVQRHVMYRHEFDEVMADERVMKYVGLEGEPAIMTGLATFTNDLDAMPLISPEYFARRWPDRYAERRIWYIGFFAVHPEHRGTGMFEAVIGNMWQLVLAGHGIAALDICRRNDRLGLPQAIHQTLESLSPGAAASRMDEQTFWLYETPPAS